MPEPKYKPDSQVMPSLDQLKRAAAGEEVKLPNGNVVRARTTNPESYDRDSIPLGYPVGLLALSQESGAASPGEKPVQFELCFEPPPAPAATPPALEPSARGLPASPDVSPPEQRPAGPPAAPDAETASRLASVMSDRGSIYGPLESSFENIGLMLTGLLEQHYQLKLPHPVPGHIVALFQVCVKANRAASPFRRNDDSYDDGMNYFDIARKCDKRLKE